MMKKLLLKIKNTFLTRQFFSFFAVGLINTLSSQGLYILFVSLGLWAGFSSVASDILTIVVSYFLNMAFTYKKRPSWRSFLAFPLSYLPGTLINLLMVAVCVYLLHIPKTFAKLAATPITVPTNYLAMSLVVKLSTKEK